MKKIATARILTACAVGNDTVRYAVAAYENKTVQRVLVVDVPARHESGVARPIGAMREDAVVTAMGIGRTPRGCRVLGAVSDDGTNETQTTTTFGQLAVGEAFRYPGPVTALVFEKANRTESCMLRADGSPTDEWNVVGMATPVVRL